MKIDFALEKYLKVSDLRVVGEADFFAVAFTPCKFCGLQVFAVGDQIIESDFIQFRDFRSLYKEKLYETSQCSLVQSERVFGNFFYKPPILDCIQKFFKRCYVSRLMDTEIYHIPVAKFKPNEIVYLTHQEVEGFFDATKSSKTQLKRVRDELLFRIAYFTGLRKTEILNLTFDQLLDNDQFQIQGKMDRKRTVFFDNESQIKQLALELKYLYSKEEDKKFHHEDKDYVFLVIGGHGRGKQLGRGGVFVLLNEYKKKLGIKKKVKLHSFRHTFATTLLNNGADIREVQLLLGHQNLNSTQVYTHISMQKLKSCASLLHLK